MYKLALDFIFERRGGSGFAARLENPGIVSVEIIINWLRRSRPLILDTIFKLKGRILFSYRYSRQER